jgi:hypothetical protein
MLPLRRWRRQSTVVFVLCLLGSLLLLAAVLYKLEDMGRAALVGAMVPVLILLALWWMSWVGGVLAQNTPNTARLVPGHVGRLRQVLAGGWLLVGLSLCALFGWAFGLSWFAQLALALGLVLLAVTARFPWLWAVLWIPPTFGWWWVEQAGTHEAVTAARHWVNGQPVIALLPTLVVGLLVMPALVTARGHAPLPRSMPADGWSGRPRSADQHALTAAVGAWLRRQGMWLYRWRLRRLCAQPQRAPVARALLVLGSLHWTSQATAAIAVVLVYAILVGLLVAVGVAPWPGFQRSSLQSAAMAVMYFSVSPLVQSPGLLRSRREQALLVLVPGLPRGPALSRALALRLSLSFGISWGLASVVALGIVGLEGEASRSVQALVFGTPPFVALYWRDWARVSPQGGLRAAMLVALLIFSGMLLGWVLRTTAPPWPVPAAASLALTAGLLAWRWHRLGRLPAAWPAGRLSTV